MSRPPARPATALFDLGPLRAELVRYKNAPRPRPSPFPRNAAGAYPPAAVPERPAVPDAAVADLVARAQAGDGEAFGQLYDRYVTTVYRYVYYRVGAAPLSEDLTSETFLKALRKIDTFSWQGRDFAAWLVTIARNLVADHFKSSRFRLEITTDDLTDTGQTVEGPEDQVLAELTNEKLLAAVKALKPEQQECIVLRFLQGMSVGETALAMGKNEGAIKTLQFRAVRALARLLPEDAIR